MAHKRLGSVATGMVVAMLFASGLLAAPAAALPVRGPSVTINQAAGQADPSSTSPVSFTVVFSQAVTGFTGSDVDVAHGPAAAAGPSTAAVSGGPATYDVSVSGMTSSGGIEADIPAGVVTNSFGGTNEASTSTDNLVKYYGPPPTINQAASQPDPTSTSPLAYSVTFAGPVTGFDGSDVSFAGSTAGGALEADVSGSGASYTVSVRGMTTAGIVVASIPAGAAQDEKEGPTVGSTSTDNTVTWQLAGSSSPPPTVVINQASRQADPTSTSPIFFTATFSSPVTGFSSTGVSFAGSTAGGTLSAAVSGSGASYSVLVSNMTTSGTVVASILPGAAQDASTASSAASTSTDNTVTWAPPATRPAPPKTHIGRLTVNTHAGTAHMRFTASGTATKFQCALSKAHIKPHFATCRSPKTYHRLHAGNYRFEVRAIGPGGTDATPAERHFSVTK